MAMVISFVLICQGVFFLALQGEILSIVEGSKAEEIIKNVDSNPPLNIGA